MTTLTKLDPKTVADRLKDKSIVLIDIREEDEYAREHIAEAVSLPMSSIETADLTIETSQHAVFHCRSGMRTETNCALLASRVEGDAYILQGGLEAWKTAGLPTERNTSAPLEINRQVQITAGALILAGVGLGIFVHPAFLGLSAFVGAGLTFAGVSGWCGMAKLLTVMPWNKRAVA